MQISHSRGRNFFIGVSGVRAWSSCTFLLEANTGSQTILARALKRRQNSMHRVGLEFGRNLKLMCVSRHLYSLTEARDFLSFRRGNWKFQNVFGMDSNLQLKSWTQRSCLTLKLPVPIPGVTTLPYSKPVQALTHPCVFSLVSLGEPIPRDRSFWTLLASAQEYPQPQTAPQILPLTPSLFPLSQEHSSQQSSFPF